MTTDQMLCKMRAHLPIVLVLVGMLSWGFRLEGRVGQMEHEAAELRVMVERIEQKLDTVGEDVAFIKGTLE